VARPPLPEDDPFRGGQALQKVRLYLLLDSPLIERRQAKKLR
jgi:hypothetical protein